MYRPNYNIIQAYRDDEFGDVIYHVVKTSEPTIQAGADFGKEKHQYTAVKAGLSWPTNESPGYYIIMGQAWDGRFRRWDAAPRKYGLVFMCDRQQDYQESRGVKRFLDHLTDDCIRYACDTVYTSLVDAREQEYADMFRDYMSQNPNYQKGFTISIEQAPFSDVENFILGVQLITDMDEAGKIDIEAECLAHQQIEMIDAEILADSPDKKLYALNAFRYVIGAYHKYDFQPVIMEVKPDVHWLAKGLV
jgi:hypothetical protein